MRQNKGVCLMRSGFTAVLAELSERKMFHCRLMILSSSIFSGMMKDTCHIFRKIEKYCVNWLTINQSMLVLTNGVIVGT